MLGKLQLVRGELVLEFLHGAQLAVELARQLARGPTAAGRLGVAGLAVRPWYRGSRVVMGNAAARACAETWRQRTLESVTIVVRAVIYEYHDYYEVLNEH